MRSWLQRTADRGIEDKLSSLLRAGYLAEGSVMVHELDTLTLRWGELQAAFPASTLHAVAVKANPLREVLKVLVERGAGLEVASSGELSLALAAGCPPDRVVFDSPAKTETELREAFRWGVRINANSAAELDRIERLAGGSTSRIGIRYNPSVAGTERESATMVATPGSKFGLSESALLDAVRGRPWVSGLHVHVGSQVATLEDLTLAAGRVLRLARAIPSIRWIDIGGGLPTRYRQTDPGLDPEDYAQALRDQAAGLWDYPLVTEVGRALQAGCGWAASRVEYASEGQAIIHLGADFALRESYHPESWFHEITVHDAQGALKRGPREPIDLYGPLCFAGDRLAHRRPLPRIEPGDIVVLHDTGAYTLAMWSRYCSRPIPPVLGWTGHGWRYLRQPERPEDVVRFWSA